MMNENIRVFVYGTLKPGGINFDRYCGAKVVTIRHAYIDGDLYDLPALGYPGAIHGTNKVYGFVLAFDDATILQELDELEDYDPLRSPAANDYNRELIVTHTPDLISSVSAWVYFMNPDLVLRSGGVLVPDGWWEG
jgi:gamma-glutamylcyclotransferase (GGCT)/AIG2-like uncharacterized protein YtfP